MIAEFIPYAYLLAAVLFILGLRQLGSPKTASRGNLTAAVGMLIAIVATLVNQEIVSFGVIVAGMVVGGAIGALLATRIEMTAMPQMVAMFNGFGGGASALVASAELLRMLGAGTPPDAAVSIPIVLASSSACHQVSLCRGFLLS